MTPRRGETQSGHRAEHALGRRSWRHFELRTVDEPHGYPPPGSSVDVVAWFTIPAVAYDEDLANRIRELVEGQPDLTEKKMFGGLAFLIGGNMAVAASGQGGVMVRVDPAASDTLVATTKARLVEMRGRPMQGWLRVDPEHLRTTRQLARWVRLGTAFARTLPAKR